MNLPHTNFSRISFAIVLMLTFLVSYTVHTAPCKKKRAKKNSTIDTMGVQKAIGYHHDNPMSPEDSLLVYTLDAKRDIHELLFLWKGNFQEPRNSYVDSLFEIGFRADPYVLWEYKKKYHPILNKMREDSIKKAQGR